MFGIFGAIKNLTKRAVIEGGAEGMAALASGESAAAGQADDALRQLQARLADPAAPVVVVINVTQPPPAAIAAPVAEEEKGGKSRKARKPADAVAGS